MLHTLILLYRSGSQNNYTALMFLSYTLFIVTLKDLVVLFFFYFILSVPPTLASKKLRFDYERFYVLCYIYVLSYGSRSSGSVILAEYRVWEGWIIFNVKYFFCFFFVTSCINRICIPYFFWTRTYGVWPVKFHICNKLWEEDKLSSDWILKVS